MTPVVAAVDVGTASVRGGIFDLSGRMLGYAEAEIETRDGGRGFAEQDSVAIWAAVCRALRAARTGAGVGPEDVVALGFDATCSLVLRDEAGAPLHMEQAPWDTIAWHDHRACAEADLCSGIGGPVAGHLGGSISPEMQIPKLMWLKRHRPEVWARLGMAFDLADYLTWRATGSRARANCTLTCKWGYLPQHGGWDEGFLAKAGLSDLRARTDLPSHALPPGAVVGGLTDTAAAELGLSPAARVAAGMVDAHSGALALLGGLPDEVLPTSAALIAGTSSCVMRFGPTPLPVPGVWGPFPEVSLPGFWMTEGGQSASGGLLNHICHLWTGAAATPALHARIAARISELRASEGWDFARQLHVLPDFQGNRGPAGGSDALGVISGLDMDRGFDALCRVYWRSSVALALGLRQIVEHFARHGAPLAELHFAGGHARSSLMADLYASATGCRVRRATSSNAMLLGGAISAATAAGLYPDVMAAAAAMRPETELHLPKREARAALDRDYRIFLTMQDQRRTLEDMSRADA